MNKLIALFLLTFSLSIYAAPPPRQIPEELKNAFTLNDEIPVQYWYFDNTYSTPRNYTTAVIDDFIQRAHQREGVGYGEGTDPFLYAALDKLKDELKGKEVVVIGSTTPWYEAVMLAYGAIPTAIEYGAITTTDPRITYLTPSEYAKNPKKFDFVLSVSSTEHDGLGRYGDPIDPDGDLKSMRSFGHMLKPGGKLILAIPIGKEKLVWNAHRIYGEKRLKMMFRGWDLVESFGFETDDFNKDRSYKHQPTFVLTKEKSASVSLPTCINYGSFSDASDKTVQSDYLYQAGILSFNGAPEILSLILNLKRTFRLDMAVETGTYKGNTTLALGDIFDSVHSIDSNSDCYESTKKALKDFSHLHFYLGSSETTLKEILPPLKEKNILFYLDAHTEGKSPLLEELEAIALTHKDNCVLLIDDIQVPNDPEFTSSKVEPLSLEYLQKHLSHVFTDYTTHYILPHNKASRAKLLIVPNREKAVSLLIKMPTRGRFEQFFKTLDTYYAHLSGEESFHFLISCDADDPIMNSPEAKEKFKGYQNLSVYYGNSKTKIEACNADMDKHPLFDVLMLASDDMIPLVKGFDKIILSRMRTHFPKLDGILHFYDGEWGPPLCTLPIMGRNFYRQFGYVYYPGYQTCYCDREMTELAKLINKHVFFDEIIIEHRHPWNGKRAMDPVYRKNSERHLWNEDEALFFTRRADNFGQKIETRA